MAKEVKVEQQGVTIGFNNTPYVPAKYVFEMDDRIDEDQTLYGAVRVRKYPAYAPGSWSPVGTPFYFDQSMTLMVTEGDVVTTSEVRNKEVFGSGIVNGDSEHTLSYPVVTGLSYYIDGRAYDIRGNAISVNIAFDSIKNALVFSRPCYCVVKYSYTTQYQILRYYPNVYNDVEAYYMPDPNDYGQIMGFIKTPSHVAAIAPVVFGVTPPEGIAAEFELYRVESIGFAKDDGIWEKPPGWPGTGTYPNSNKSITTSSSYVEIARTHEIGYFSLLNNPRRMESYQSSSSEALPLDFSKQLRMEGFAGSTVTKGSSYTQRNSDGSSVTNSIASLQKVQGREHFDKYRRLLNRAPKMRTVHYDIPIAEPYKSASAVNSAKEVVRTIAVQNVVDPSGAASRRTTVNQALVTFRVKLVVKAPQRPTVSSSVIRNQSNATAVDYNTQAARINTMLSMVWEGVNWQHLRSRILAAYDSDIYEVTFDSSFPT